MTTHNIVVFAGDHCGPEVVAEGVKVGLNIGLLAFPVQNLLPTDTSDPTDTQGYRGEQS